MKTSSNKSVFNLKEATAYLGISVPTLVRLLGSGAIPYRRVGQRWLITRSALDDWLMLLCKKIEKTLILK